MNVSYIINQLELNQEVFRGLFKTDSSAEYLWRSDLDKWCLLEIICHLVDEEVLDFRARVRTALDEVNSPFVPIDPEGWVKSKNYIDQDYSAKVEEWMAERKNSVDWLKSLENMDLNSSFEHTELGTLTAGHFLANWLAHDQLHIRQINRLKRAYLEFTSGENLSYAGKW